MEQKLKDFSGPYILSDKRWERAPIYLRYGVFRDAIPNQEEPLKIDELLISGKSVKDSREPRFVVPEGIALPVFLKKWLEGSEQTESQDFPFVIKSAIRFSNSGGIYRAHLKEANKEVILREVRPYTGLDFDGKYSSDRLTAEESALVKLKDMCSVPDVLWSGTVWEHRYLAVDKMKGIPLNRWVTKNYPIYDFAVGDKKYLSRIYSILTELISLVEEAHSRNVFHQDIHLANILIDENDNVSLIDWEQARFDDTNKVEQQAAALGFGSWVNDFPSQIDWYGVKQVAHYLFFHY
ncbi:protein kinase domain-containing protein [Streptococcus equi]|uniref:class III lanthionine synthetase LanKC N-terminal domain-containing protein n=1 Tax=Streptococcus equi TaxID=1336 RepID=UPI001E420D7B|nr:phosphotransferase [Streptococcus equi]MCD3410145.1 lipopolysaccharide kinase [Streptococcus equi subsp. zooepidemicus]